MTARGWEDLSAVLKSYEKMGFPVEKILVEQYLQEEKTEITFFFIIRFIGSTDRDYRMGTGSGRKPFRCVERETITRML